MALKLTAEQKSYDNMLRQINNDLKKAYNNLGANSQQYKNLVILGSSLGLSGHANKDGTFQYDRNAKQIRERMNNNILGAIKEQYYHHNNKGDIVKDKFKKNIINQQYNVTTKVNAIKNDAKKYFNTKKPTKKQLVYMSEKDTLVSEFWYKYNDSKDNATDDDDDTETIRYHAYQDVANQIYAGYDISNKPQTDDDFDRLHNMVTQALYNDNNKLVINQYTEQGGYLIDLTTGEIVSEIDERQKAVFDADYFSGDDWTDILL